MNSINLKLAKELLAAAKAVVAMSGSESAHPHFDRWRGEIEGNPYSGVFSIIPSDVFTLDFKNGKGLDESQLRKMAGQFDSVQSSYADAKDELEKALAFIDASEYLKYGTGFDDESEAEWDNGSLDINVCATDKVYQAACEEFDRIAGGKPADEIDDELYSKAWNAANDKAGALFAGEMDKLNKAASLLYPIFHQ